MTDKEYSQLSHAFYGVGGWARLIRFLRAMEAANKQAYDEAIKEAKES